MGATQATEDLLADVLSRNDRRSGPSADSQKSVDGSTVFDHVIASLDSVVTTMCGISVSPVGEPIPGCATDRLELSGVIGIRGEEQIRIVTNMSRQFASAVVESLTGCPCEPGDEDAVDMVGELANMIAGNLKERMGERSLTLGLPTVVTGNDHRVVFPSDMQVMHHRFTSDVGEIQLEVGIEK